MSPILIGSFMNILTCPVCGEKLNIFGKTLKCDNNHSFDFAKQGYVNLLLTSKSGDKKGDSRENFCKRDIIPFYVIMSTQN